jgi:hypothetical protein
MRPTENLRVPKPVNFAIAPTITIGPHDAPRHSIPVSLAGVAMPPLVAITVLGLSLGATLAACTNSPSPAPIANVPSPQPIDGTYGGLMQLNRGDAINCGNENPITLHVANHAFTYQLNQPQAEWKPVILFKAMIGPDGAFNAQTGPDSMTGSVSGGNMQGTIIGDVCGFSFNASRGGVG